MKNTLAAVLLVSASAPLAAQDFQPFGPVSGNVTLGGYWSYCCERQYESVSVPLVFPVSVGEASLNSGESVGRLGVHTEADWSFTIDRNPIESDGPPPYSEIEAYEWEFRMAGWIINEGSIGRGSIDVEVDITLTEWTTVTLDVKSSSYTFTASIADLKADHYSSLSGLGGSAGSLWGDGRYNRSEVVPPGDYHLKILGEVTNPSQYSDLPPNPVDADVSVRFSKGACPADLTGDGILDNGDIIKYVTMFLAGC